jgi:hypothetical protein
MSSIGEGLRWFLRSRLRWVILALLIVAFLWFVPQLQGQYFSQKVPAEERPALVNEYRRTWAQILGGVAIGVGLYFTWRRIEISQRTLETTQDQQVTERFTRAIEQLGATDNEGNKLLEMRLGGIYALERIARESEQDYWPIMEVLTAYVRHHAAPRRPEEGRGGVADASVQESEEDSSRASESTEGPFPDPDIYAILTVLRRRSRHYEHGEPEPLDLHNTNLLSANLSRANLSGANLSGVDLSNADLSPANLARAKLPGAKLWGANLSPVDLSNADLKGADLEGAKLAHAYLWGADFSGAKNLTKVQIEGAAVDGSTKLPSHLKEG